MKLNSSYNPENNKFVLEVTTNLVNDYFYNLRGMLLDSNEVPKDIEIIKKGNDTAQISFTMLKEDIEKASTPLPEDLLKKMGDAMGISSGDIKGGIINPETCGGPIKAVDSVIGDFVNAAMNHKMKRTEFLPLTGYSEEKLAQDSIAAMENKRDFCIIDKYKNYLKAQTSKRYEFNQRIVEYGTSEYYDIIIMLNTNSFKEFRNTYKNELEKIEWI